MRLKSVLLFVSAILALNVGVANANLIKNGGFESTSAGGNKKINGTSIEDDRTTLTHWVSSEKGTDRGGYNFVLDSAIAHTWDSKLWLEGENNGYTGSPTNDNFFASDSQYHPGVLSQLVKGLSVGTTYLLTFDYALAQQKNYPNANFDNYWDVGFGGVYQTTDFLSIEAKGFSGWQTAAMYFTATTAEQWLSFLTKGTAPGSPPFMLLDNVSLEAAVPEPATWMLLLGGLGLLGFMARRRNTQA